MAEKHKLEPTSDFIPTCNGMKHRKAETLFHILIDPVSLKTLQSENNIVLKTIKTIEAVRYSMSSE